MLTELRTFVAVARYGTMSRAADRIALTQSAVSGHIRRLEEHLGFPLFERTGRSARLNAAGIRTLERAQALLAQFDALGDPNEESGTGTLRIGAISSVQSSMLTRALAAFRDRFPLVRVHVVPGLSLHLLNQVDAGELDVAVLVRPPFDLPAELDWHLLSREDYVLIAPVAAEGATWQELLQRQPFLRYDRLSFGGRQVDRFVRTLPFAVADGVEVPVQLMLAMVQDGLGVALIPAAEAHLRLPAEVRCLPLPAGTRRREIGFVRSRRDAPGAAAQHLHTCLIAAAR